MKRTASTIISTLSQPRQIFLTIFLAVLFALPVSQIQAQQVIGSFPEMDGGMEGQSTANIVNYTGGIPPNTLGPKNYYGKKGAPTTIFNSSGRSGLNYLSWGGTNTGYYVLTPTAASMAIADNTAYTIQFYYKSNIGSTGSLGLTLYTSANNGSIPTGGGTEVNASISNTNAWTKSTTYLTSGSGVIGARYGIIAGRVVSAGLGTNLIDDLVVYPGDVDVDAPDNPTSATAVSASATSLNVSWSAPGTGTDGGGYVVVRGTTDPTTAPNVNGIYAFGNTVATGQIVVYIGTGTSFTDASLTTGTPYYYRIYTADKAFNYSTAAAVVGIPYPTNYPTVSTGTVAVPTSGLPGTNASVSGSVVSADGGSTVSAYGIVWGTSSNPTVALPTKTNDGGGLATFGSAITGLSLNTPYYARAYATNANGTSYGIQYTFTTHSIPTISTTTTVTNLSFDGAMVTGNVTGVGLETTERGVIYKLTNAAPNYASDPFTVHSTTSSTGSFSLTLGNLAASTLYYVTPYAKNSLGVVYGSTSSFTTLAVVYNWNTSGTYDISTYVNWYGSVTPLANQMTAGQFRTTDRLVYNIVNGGAVNNTNGFKIDPGPTFYNTRIKVGDGANAITFTIDGTNSYLDSVDVANKATLTVQNTAMPLFGAMSSGTPGSTVIFSNVNFSYISTAPSFYNVTLTGTGSIAANLTLNVAGTFTAPSTTIANSGATVNFNGTAQQTVPAFGYQNLTTSNAAGCNTPGTSKTITVYGTLSVTENLTIGATDKLVLTSGSTLAIAAGKSLIVNGTLEDQHTGFTLVPTGTVIINSGGYYTINGNNQNTQFVGTNFTFNPGSNLEIKTSGTSGGLKIPDILGGNLIWDVAVGTSKVLFINGASATIAGDFTVKATGTGAGMITNSNSNTSRSLSVGGKFKISGGEYDIRQGGSGNTNQYLIVTGDVEVAGGKLYVNGYSGGTTTGEITIRGNVIHTAGLLGTPVSTTPNSKFKFTGTSEQTIETLGGSGGLTGTNDFNISGAGVKLTAGVLNLQYLTFTSGNFTVATGTTLSPPGESPYLSGHPANGYVITTGTGVLKYSNTFTAETLFPVGVSSSSYNPVKITNNGSADRFSVNVGTSFTYPPLSATFTNGVQYDISKETNPTTPISATIVCQWNSANEQGGFNTVRPGVTTLSELVFGHYVTGWSEFHPTAMSSMSGGGPYTVTYTGNTSFSPFGVGVCGAFASNICGVLPVNILSFTGQNNNGVGNLVWKTAAEENIEHYIVERSADATLYESLGTVTARNTGAQTSYQFNDNRTAGGGVFYYRLKILGKDGRYKYSQVIALNFKKGRSLQAFPNPVKNTLFLVHDKAAGKATVQIFSSLGAKVASVNVAQGSEQTSINTAGFAKGIYMLRFEGGNGQEVLRFVKD